MSFYDPLAAKFANRPLDAWQVSKKNFDFDGGFVKWIQKYLEARKVVFDVLAAKQWINGAKFDEKRYEDCSLQWEGYQESLKVVERPALKPVVSNSGLSGGDLDGADQSGVDGAVDAVRRSPLPPDMEEIEGESDADRAARCRKYVQEKLKKMAGSW